MIALVIGLLVGYVLAIPPGPIGMAAVRIGLRNGINSARMLACGAGIFDLLYCFVALTMSATVASFMSRNTYQSPIVMGLGIMVALVIIGVGIHQYRNPIELIDDQTTADAPLGRPFAAGVAYALANLANPTFVPSLLVMSAYIIGLGLVGPDTSDRVLFSVGFGTGNVLWLLTLVHMLVRFRDRLPQQTFTIVQRLMAAIVIGFGVVAGMRLAFQ